MFGRVQLLLVAALTAVGVVAAAPAVLADTEVSTVAYVCGVVDPGTARVDADGTTHIRGMISTGESVSDDGRLDGLFRRRTNLTIYPDGSGAFWGVHQQRSSGYDGSWNIRFSGVFDNEGFLGHGVGIGERDFEGLSLSGLIVPHPGGDNPCNPVIEVSEFVGVLSD